MNFHVQSFQLSMNYNYRLHTVIIVLGLMNFYRQYYITLCNILLYRFQIKKIAHATNYIVKNDKVNNTRENNDNIVI